MSEETKTLRRCEAITSIISSVAAEQTGLANIINVEAEKIKTVLATSKDTDDILAANKSVDKMINSITKLEIILSGKLELFHDCLCVACDGESPGYSILSMTVESERGGTIEREDDLKTFNYYPGTSGTSIKFITEPATTIVAKSALPSGLKFEKNLLIIPDGYNWTQTYSMIFTVGSGDNEYDITLRNIM